MDLRRLLEVLNRRGWALLIGPLVAGAAAFLVSSNFAPPPMYEASARVLVGAALTAPDANAGELAASERLSEVYVEVATSRPLLERAAEALGDMDAASLQSQVTAVTGLEPPIITVTATALDARLAADIANEIVRQLIAVSPTLSPQQDQAQDFVNRQLVALEREIESLVPEAESLAGLTARTEAQDERLASLQSRLDNLRGTYAALTDASSGTASNTITLIEEAVPPLGPAPSGRQQNTILAAMLGLALAIAVVVLLEHLDDTVHSPGQITNVAELPSLGEVRRLAGTQSGPQRIVASDHPAHSSRAEGFRALRTNIDFSTVAPLHSLLITSSLDGEGKSTVALNLAVAFAQAGRHVILVDADVRKPELHRLFGLNNDRGFSDLLRSPDASAVDLTQQTSVGRLRLLAAGPPLDRDPADLIASFRSTRLADRIDGTGGLVIVDGPAVLVASESIMLSAMVDATVMVVAAGRTRLIPLGEALAALSRAKANTIGTVMNYPPNNRTARPPDVHRRTFDQAPASPVPDTPET